MRHRWHVRARAAPVIQLIRNCDIYAPEHVGLRDLLVANGRVEVVTTAESLDSLPAAVRVVEIDLVGRRLIPALIDGPRAHHWRRWRVGAPSRGSRGRARRAASRGQDRLPCCRQAPSMPTTAAACRLD